MITVCFMSEIDLRLWKQYLNLIAAWLWTMGGIVYLNAIERREKGQPQVKEIQYNLDVTTRASYLTSPLRISKHRQGGQPWYVFPPETTRRHIEWMYDQVVVRGQLPTEKNLLRPDYMSRTELRAIRDHLLVNRWAVLLRAGNNAPWELTPQGKKNLVFWYLRLNGRIPAHSPTAAHARPIPREDYVSEH